MTKFKSKSYNKGNVVQSENSTPKEFPQESGYQNYQLSSPKSTRNNHLSALLHPEEEQETESSDITLEQFQDLIQNHQKARDAMQIIYHVWEEDELDNVFALFDSAKDSKDKIKIKHDDEHLVFEYKDQQVKVKFDKALLHHIHSYCHGPIDTVAKLNYHSRNVGPVDSSEEIKYLTDTPGPIDTIMELLYHVRNEGQVDTVFEWYRLVRNSGDISSRDEIQYHNQNLGPQDTRGEYLRRSKNVGPVDTPDERGFYGITNNAGSTDIEEEIENRMNPFRTDFKPY